MEIINRSFKWYYFIWDSLLEMWICIFKNMQNRPNMRQNVNEKS